jgi:lysozyme family protein
MASANYDACLKRLLVHEGGYSNHPNDPGGPTNFGITLADFRAYIKTNATAADVKAMTLAQAAPIYRTHYWDALRCDDLPSGVDYALFDYGVNSGIARAAKVIRRIVGAQDSTVIDAALIALIAKADAGALVAAICDERLAFLKSLKTWPGFGTGWARRVAEVRTSALAMAASAAKPVVVKPPTATPAPSLPKAATVAATTVVVAASAAVTQQSSLSGYGAGLIVLAVLAIVLAGVAAFVVWKRRHGQTAVVIQEETSHGVE